MSRSSRPAALRSCVAPEEVEDAVLELVCDIIYSSAPSAKSLRIKGLLAPTTMQHGWLTFAYTKDKDRYKDDNAAFDAPDDIFAWENTPVSPNTWKLSLDPHKNESNVANNASCHCCTVILILLALDCTCDDLSVPESSKSTIGQNSWRWIYFLKLFAAALSMPLNTILFSRDGNIHWGLW